MLMTGIRKQSVGLVVCANVLLLAGCRSSTNDLVSSHFPKRSESAGASKLGRVSRRSENANSPPGGQTAASDLVQVSADQANPSLKDQVEPIGEKLAAASSDKQMKFYFGYLENPSPRGQHTSNGHVFVTTGMLSQMTSAEELAGVLALEMAELLAEKQLEQTGSESSIIQAAATQADSQNNKPTDPVKVDRIARSLLDTAGYKTVDLKSIRSKLDQMSRQPTKVGRMSS
jgi:predicted Zn-dependent protease